MSYQVMGEVANRTRVEVTHACGHVQVCTPQTKVLQKGEELYPGYTERHFSWLSRNLCPGCFTAAKLENPIYKPAE